ncbi:hypothetical protein HYDPIDRAFT_27845 [Hydnomerulius pinastri MD-312]|uniref:Uncharacterized protein n=1 Tax=Hydnomerulius pinastri MD-312 TaxID=994086 RepID=A0A0C9WAT5_9AGAM|nr:hypothetical protein HYDPIDRAFT_27845 [Hydnomerulius pinastri MD-312]
MTSQQLSRRNLHVLYLALQTLYQVIMRISTSFIALAYLGFAAAAAIPTVPNPAVPNPAVPNPAVPNPVQPDTLDVRSGGLPLGVGKLGGSSSNGSSDLLRRGKPGHQEPPTGGDGSEYPTKGKSEGGKSKGGFPIRRGKSGSGSLLGPVLSTPGNSKGSSLGGQTGKGGQEGKPPSNGGTSSDPVAGKPESELTRRDSSPLGEAGSILGSGGKSQDPTKGKLQDPTKGKLQDPTKGKSQGGSGGKGGSDKGIPVPVPSGVPTPPTKSA